MHMLDRLMVYFPERELWATPADAGLEYEDVYLEAADGARIHAWHIPGGSDATLLWLHGNAGNMSHRVDNIALLNIRVGVSVFIIDYRGYGKSEGRPSERGILLDAEAALSYLANEKALDPAKDIALFGRSLGVGVAAEMATRRDFRCVILESGFTSVSEMAKAVYPMLPVSLLLPFVEARYDSLSKMSRVRSPLMIVHGERDEIVPFEMAERLHAAAPEPKRLYAIRGAAHNDTYAVGGEPYFDALRRFIAQPAAAR